MRIALVSTAQKSGCPPIGLVYLASYIQGHSQYKTDIIDANYQNIFRVDYSKYDLIGISAMTVNYTKALELANWIKFWCSIPIIIGGVHISTCPESFNSIFDSMVIGEGERAFIELLFDLETNNLKQKY
ncbi:MAG: cobalamin-dependent protein, partial [Nanoarchaeota archaeon]